jgi:hypothetical protein
MEQLYTLLLNVAKGRQQHKKHERTWTNAKIIRAKHGNSAPIANIDMTSYNVYFATVL